jgi:hypothetical protein
MISSFQLPLRFDAHRLQTDIVSIHPDEWTAHFNSGYHDGGWSGVSLRSVDGNARRLYPDPTHREAFSDTDALRGRPAIGEVLAALKCPQASVRLLKLAAGARIKEHRDYNLDFDDGELRLHIPVATNPGVAFFLAGQKVDMHEGECWYLNLNLPHRVDNDGQTDRVHLVVDCIVNSWLRSFFPVEMIAPAAGAFSERAAVCQSLALFREHVLEDRLLQEQLCVIDDHDVFITRVVQLGRERGYQFAARDVGEALRAGRQAWLAR